MNLIIFGLTGTVGRQLIRQALAQQHVVTAFTRTRAKLEMEHANLRVLTGDVMDPADVEKAVRGQDVVLCSLGGGRKSKVRSQGTRNIIRAMERAGIPRFICQTTLGVGSSRSNLNFFWKHIMFGLLLRPMFEDHVLQEDYVKQSQLNWTIVRPGAFTDGPLTDAYRHGFSGTDRSVTLKISRADVAAFMLKQLDTDAYLLQTPGLSY